MFGNYQKLPVELYIKIYRMKDYINLILASAELPKKIHPDDLKRFQASTNLNDKQINKLTPSDVYGRGWANARKAYELGKTLYPAPVKLPSLDHKTDQMIKASLSDPFYFYRILIYLESRERM